MLTIRYVDARWRYATFPYPTEAGPSIPLLPHPALLRVHVRTRLRQLYGRQRLAGRLRQRLAALDLRARSLQATLPEGQEFWAVEVLAVWALLSRLCTFLCRHHHLAWEDAYGAILPLWWTAYTCEIHWRRRPWLQLAARCWN
jgi:hypothetical protein